MFKFSDEMGQFGSVSRLLQLIVLVLISYKAVLGFANGKRFVIPCIFQLKPYFLWLFYIIIVSLIAVFLQGYNLQEKFGSLQFLEPSSRIKINWVIYESVILIYQLVYFVILAPLMLSKAKHLDFFFKAATFILVLHFIVGWVDYLLVFKVLILFRGTFLISVT